MAKIATITNGPSKWHGQRGPLTRETEDRVWLMVSDHDDGKDGQNLYELTLPKDCVTLEEEEDPTDT